MQNFASLLENYQIIAEISLASPQDDEILHFVSSTHELIVSFLRCCKVLHPHTTQHTTYTCFI